MDWVPPAEPEKPCCPYVAGFRMAVTSHNPPSPPFAGGSYRPPEARRADGYDDAPGRVEVPGTDDDRIHAFARAAESYLKLAMAGVAQADFAPRNIFLIGDLRDPRLRAVVSDFNVAKVFSRMNPSRRRRSWLILSAFVPTRIGGAISDIGSQSGFSPTRTKRNSRLSIEFPSMIHEASGNSEIGT